MITKIETLAANLDAKKLFLTTMATKKWSKPGVQKITLNLRIMWKDVNEENEKKGKVVFSNDFILILNSNLLKQDLKKMYFLLNIKHKVGACYHVLTSRQKILPPPPLLVSYLMTVFSS